MQMFDHARFLQPFPRPANAKSLLELQLVQLIKGTVNAVFALKRPPFVGMYVWYTFTLAPLLCMIHTYKS